jgi:ribonucleotide monophosphatase NagD (HAD superfamily)
VVVGDDVEVDVLGGQAAGMTGVLVRTGKFRPDAEEGVDGDPPQHVIDSVADLPASWPGSSGELSRRTFARRHPVPP